MPTTQLQRMMFLQGQLCFFCNRIIPKGEASLEHLVPSSTGGSEHPDNLVACCQSLNAIFGSMSVKEKIRVILKQNGKFVCPNQPTQPQPKQATARQQQTKTPTKPALNNGTDANVPAKHGKPWTPAEDKKLAAAFDAQANIPALAKAHKRGAGGIQSRLIKLGKLAPEQPKANPPEAP
ncbi:MAG: hypothetical protein IAF94_10110 [Pirellulaceae bacterium]|nr:hypothetical protein [Pirellulaceae bacterium]